MKPWCQIVREIGGALADPGGQGMPCPSGRRRVGRGHRRLLAPVLIASLVGVAIPAAGHPHVWIKVVATVLFHAGEVAAIQMEWTFDEAYGDGLRQTFDRDRSGAFEDGEIRLIQQAVFGKLKPSRYLTHVTVDTTPVPIEPSDFTAMLRDGRTVFRFSVPLPQPVDARTTPISLSVYDEAFFIDIRFAAERPIRFRGVPVSACQADVRENTDKPVFFGAVFPEIATVQCGPF
jgi:tRNA threonylcarbamoyladenosine biosynthesis protein TsaE